MCGLDLQACLADALVRIRDHGINRPHEPLPWNRAPEAAASPGNQAA